MLLVVVATAYLMSAFAIVLTVDRIAGMMFKVPHEAAPSIFRLAPGRLFRKAVSSVAPAGTFGRPRGWTPRNREENDHASR